MSIRHYAARSGGLAAVLGAVLVTPATAAPPLVTIPGPMPASVVQDFSTCPAASAFPANAGPFVCIRLTARNGELKIGKTVASIDDPISVVVGVGVGTTPGPDGSLPTAIIPAGGPSVSDATGGGAGAGPSAVKIPGGILGIPELDPLFDNSFGLLSVGAIPSLGEATVGNEGDNPTEAGFAFLNWVSGEDPLGGGSWEDSQVALGLPLSIRLVNTLFGSKCAIPEFKIHLTNGPTTPPSGIAPMVGSNGSAAYNYYPDANDAQISVTDDSVFVDNTFAVEGAKKCDLVVGDLLNQPAGLLDNIISAQVGLPAAAGTNHARFTVDSAVAGYGDLLSARVSPGSLAFGQITSGWTSTVKTITYSNTGMFPIKAMAAAELFAFNAVDEPKISQYQIADDRCVNRTLAPAETCQVDVRFAPTSTGSKSGIRVRMRFNSNEIQTPLSGTGSATTGLGNPPPPPTPPVVTPPVVTPPVPAPAPKPCILIRLSLFGQTICI